MKCALNASGIYIDIHIFSEDFKNVLKMLVFIFNFYFLGNSGRDPPLAKKRDPPTVSQELERLKNQRFQHFKHLLN